MDAEATARTSALRILAHFVTSADGRKRLKEAGYQSGQPMEIVLSDDTLVDVVDRVTRHDPPVFVAIYFPSSQKLGLVKLDRGRHSDAHSYDAFNGASSFGMLYNLLVVEHPAPLAFRLTEWSDYTAQPIEPPTLIEA